MAPSVAETLHEVVHAEPVSPRVLNPSLPLDLATICLKCLEKEPARRYSSAQELADELGRVLRGEPIRARPVTRAERLWRWCRRNPVTATFATTAALLLVAVAIGSPIAALRIYREKQRTEQIARDRRLDVYVADMKVAHLALQEDNRGLAVERLRNDMRQEQGEEDLRGFEWRYLWKLCQGDELFTLPGHRKRVVSVAFDRTGTWLASSSDDDTVRIWNIDRREVAQVLAMADPVLTSVAFSPIDDALAIGGGTQVRIRQGARWNSERILDRAHAPLVFAPDGRTLVTDGQGGIMIWDTATWQMVRRLDGLHACNYSEHFSNLAFSPDGMNFALASYEEHPEGRRVLLRVWPFASLKSAGLAGSPPVLLDPGTNKLATIQAVRFSSDGQLLAAGDWSGLIGLWETESGRLVASTNTAAIITGLVFLNDGCTLVSTTSDQQLSVWDYSSRTELVNVGRPQEHDSEVWGAALSPNGQLLATGGKDAMVKFWDVSKLRDHQLTRRRADVELPLEHHPIWISHDGWRVAAVNGRFSLNAAWTEDASRISFVDTGTLDTADSLSFNAPFKCVAITTNGNRLAEAWTNGVVEIWDVANKQRPVTRLELPVDDSGAPWKRSPFGWKFSINEVWSPNGNRLVTFWPRVTVWDIPSGRGREVPVRGEVIAAGFSADGTTLAVAVWEGVELWNSQTGQRIALCQGPMAGNSRLGFSLDGRTLLATANEKVWLWDLPSGTLRGTLATHSLWFDHAAFSADGRTIATHCGGAFTFWNVRNRQELFSIALGRLGQGKMLFSGDGQLQILHKAKHPALVLRAPAQGEIDAAENATPKAK